MPEQSEYALGGKGTGIVPLDFNSFRESPGPQPTLTQGLESINLLIIK